MAATTQSSTIDLTGTVASTDTAAASGTISTAGTVAAPAAEVPTAAPVPASPPVVSPERVMTISEFMRQLSQPGRGQSVELIHGFLFHAQSEGILAGTFKELMAQYEAFKGAEPIVHKKFGGPGLVKS